MFAIGDVAGLQAWALQDSFKAFYIINADLTDNETTIKADSDKYYYIETTDDSPYYEDSFALYASCNEVDADFEYRRRNGLADAEEELLLAIQNASKKFKF